MKFCPECGKKYDGSGVCRGCGTRFPASRLSEEETNELLLFRDFQFERVAGGVHLLRCVNSELCEFVAPATVTAIGTACFSGCAALTDVDLTKSRLTELPSSAFADCTELTTVLLPPTLTRIGDRAFCGCGELLDLSVPEGVTEIGDRAFFGCGSLCDISLPTTLAVVGEQAFSGCDILSEVAITDLAAFCRISFAGPEANPAFFSNGLTLNGEEICDLRIPAGVDSLLPFTFAGCDSIESLHIPASVQIDPLAFLCCDSLERVTVSGSHYFYREESNCVLTKDSTLVFAAAYADIPGDVKRIRRGALSAAAFREELCLPRGAVLEPGALFACVGLSHLELSLLPGSAATMRDLLTARVTLPHGSLTLYEPCGALTELVLLDAPRIDAGFFRDIPTVTSLTLPRTLRELPGVLLSGLPLKSLTLPSSIESILPPFYCPTLERLTAEPCGRYTIREGTLYDTKTDTLIASLGKTGIPAGTRHIADGAFRGNKRLTSLTVPEGVTGIGKMAFADCVSLRELHLPDTLRMMHGSMLLGSNAIERVLLSTMDFWSVRVPGESKATSFILGGRHDPLRYFNQRGSSYTTFVKARIEPDKYYTIPD